MASEAESFESESALIDLFGRKDNGTGILRNLTDGGEGPSGYIQSEALRQVTVLNLQKLWEANRGKVCPEDTRRKIGESNRGKVRSEETRRKLRENHRGMLGKILSEETRRKISERDRGKVLSEEARRKISEAGKGRVTSEETRRKLSEAMIVSRIFRPAYAAAKRNHG
jgi:hypothetical protein